MKILRYAQAHLMEDLYCKKREAIERKNSEDNLVKYTIKLALLKLIVN